MPTDPWQDEHPRALGALLAGVAAWVALRLHGAGIALGGPARPRLGSTLRDLANLAALVVLALGLRMAGLAGPHALLVSGTLLAGRETAARRPAAGLAVVAGAMLAAGWPQAAGRAAERLVRALSP